MLVCFHFVYKATGLQLADFIFHFLPDYLNNKIAVPVGIITYKRILIWLNNGNIMGFVM